MQMNISESSEEAADLTSETLLLSPSTALHLPHFYHSYII